MRVFNGHKDFFKRLNAVLCRKSGDSLCITFDFQMRVTIFNIIIIKFIYYKYFKEWGKPIGQKEKTKRC